MFTTLEALYFFVSYLFFLQLLYEKNFEEQFLFEENQFKMVSGPTLPPMPNESEYSEKKNTTDEIQSMLKQVCETA